MRILFDSKQTVYKDPFGCLTPGQSCTLHIHVPATVQATDVQCVFHNEDGSHAFTVPMRRSAAITSMKRITERIIIVSIFSPLISFVTSIFP